ncbi:MAG: hypothetical protein ACC654_11295 [Acidimicrobiia bacterium]
MLVVVACGGGDSAQPTNPSGSETEAPTVAESDAAPSDAEEFAEDLVEDLEAQQAASGGGSATLIVGDREWTFTSVLCAFGEDQIGQEGAEFVLSSLQDGMQMYASIDSFGHSLTLDDIEDFENPSISLRAEGDGFIIVDGKTVTVEAEFVDDASDSFDPIPGSFTAACP